MINKIASINTSDTSSVFVLIATIILIVVLLTGWVLMQEFSRSSKVHRTVKKSKGKRKTKR